MTGDWAKKGVIAKRTEVEGEAFKVFIIDRLIGENQDMMLEPSGSKLAHLLFVERKGEVDPRDLGPTGLARRVYLNRQVASSC